MGPITFGSLFAGIGGFDLGLERAGFRCAWQVEINPWCRRVLAKHWPDAKRHDDVRTFPPTSSGEWGVDLIAGGFPCQDLSRAGSRVGIGGERSGLWAEFARVIRVVRPRHVLVENVAAIIDGGLGRVLGDLATCGYDAEWDCLPACSFGASHVRDRLFLVGRSVPVAPVFHVDRERRGELDAAAVTAQPRVLDRATEEGRVRGWDRPPGTEPVVRRMANGIPSRVDRLRGLGNSICPPAAEWIGRRLMKSISVR